MVDFVQIGNWAFSPAEIQTVRFSDSGWVYIGFTGLVDDVVLAGAEGRAFKNWWAKEPRVYFLDPEWFTEDEEKK
jgi:hypothetical protein